jgi:hypothetical protein
MTSVKCHTVALSHSYIKKPKILEMLKLHMWQVTVTLSHCHTKKNKNPKNPKIACDKQEMSYFYAVIMSQQKEQKF